jgi:predicted ester cyclase
MHDRAAGRQYMQGWFTAFPDMQVRTTNRVFGDDFIAAEVEFTGTNSGPLSMAEWNCRQPVGVCLRISATTSRWNGSPGFAP